MPLKVQLTQQYLYFYTYSKVYKNVYVLLILRLLNLSKLLILKYYFIVSLFYIVEMRF